MTKPSPTIIYIDMDHVLCDYDAGFTRHSARFPDLEFPQSQPGLYIGLEPMEGAVEAYHWLDAQPATEVYILTAPSIRNPHCYSEKREWVEKHLGMSAVANLIISPHKHLNRGDFLIDDSPSGRGQERFEGELILFGGKDYLNWASVIEYLNPRLAGDVGNTGKSVHGVYEDE